jgi:plasmid stabilization system protein ParE
MVTNVRFVELAETELDDATAYYEAEASMGVAFVNEIEHVLSLAMEFPESGTLVP